MTFLNIILLGGLSAAGIPVLIHLLNRNRFKVVKWGAMHLLEAAFQPNQRRLEIEHWLLLLVRAKPECRTSNHTERCTTPWCHDATTPMPSCSWPPGTECRSLG